MQTELTYTTKDRVLTSQIVVLGPKQVRRISTSELVRDRKDIGVFGGVSVRIRHGADTLRISHFMVDETSGTSAMLKVFEHAALDDPAQNTLRAPMIALQTPDPVLGITQGSQLTPSVVLRNTTSHPLDIVTALNWKSATDTGSLPLPSLTLAAGETRSLDIAALQKSGAVPMEAQWGSLALSYKGNDNDLIALEVTTDQVGKVVAQTAFTQTLGSIFKGTAWYADSLRKSLITVGNGGTQPTTASVVLYYNNAQDRYELRPKLNPGQQAWIDVAQLIQNQVPDAYGKTIPPDVTFGSYELRDPNHIGQGTLFEGKLTIDKTFGNAAYGCVLECCYWDPAVDPTPYSGYVGTGNQDTAWATCMDDGVDYDITGITSWTSGNLGVAQFSGYIGYFNLVGAGSSHLTTSAFIESPYKVPYCHYMTRTGPGTANGTPTISIQGSLGYVYIGHDPQVTQHINAFFGSGNPTGGSYTWSSPDSSVSFDSTTAANTHVTATSYSGGTGDTKIALNYSSNGVPANPASVWVTKRLFKYLGEDTKTLISTYTGPSVYGYRYQASYKVHTNPNGQLVGDGNGVGVTEDVSTVSSNVPFNPTYSTGALDSNSLVQDTLSLTNNAPLPSNLQIINTQVIGVGGFYVRTNTLTYTANGVNIQSGGPSN